MNWEKEKEKNILKMVASNDPEAFVLAIVMCSNDITTKSQYDFVKNQIAIGYRRFSSSLTNDQIKTLRSARIDSQKQHLKNKLNKV